MPRATRSRWTKSRLSRKFIAFTLFWRNEQIGTHDAHVPGFDIKWEAVRRKLTRFLEAVHAREYALPFPEHDVCVFISF